MLKPTLIWLVASVIALRHNKCNVKRLNFKALITYVTVGIIGIQKQLLAHGLIGANSSNIHTYMYLFSYS